MQSCTCLARGAVVWPVGGDAMDVVQTDPRSVWLTQRTAACSVSSIQTTCVRTRGGGAKDGRGQKQELAHHDSVVVVWVLAEPVNACVGWCFESVSQRGGQRVWIGTDEIQAVPPSRCVQALGRFWGVSGRSSSSPPVWMPRRAKRVPLFIRCGAHESGVSTRVGRSGRCADPLMTKVGALGRPSVRLEHSAARGCAYASAPGVCVRQIPRFGVHSRVPMAGWRATCKRQKDANQETHRPQTKKQEQASKQTNKLGRGAERQNSNQKLTTR